MDKPGKRCPTCGGLGRQNCTWCFGIGRKSVMVTKQVWQFGKYVTQTGYESQVCGPCNGTGKMMCVGCQGKGWRV